MNFVSRLLAVVTFIVVVPGAFGQQPPPVVKPPQLAPETKVDSVPMVKVFALRNIAAVEMQKTLRDLYGEEGDLVVSAQPQTNQIIVTGSESTLESVQSLLVILDKSSAEPVVQMLPSDSGSSVSKSLASAVARSAQVELAFDDELGVMVVRSESEERVKSFTEVLQKLNAQIREQSRVVEREVLIRVTWLMPRDIIAGTNPIDPEPGLKEAIDKLTSMGYSNLAVTGQLMTRCSISSSSPNNTPEFEAEGHTAAGFDLAVRGSFVRQGNRGDGSVDVNMSVNVKQATKAENSNNCLLSVVLKLKEGKPIILGSAPVAGAQSFFVVQFISAD